jgi:small subunit ribosomal protein S11
LIKEKANGSGGNKDNIINLVNNDKEKDNSFLSNICCNSNISSQFLENFEFKDRKMEKVKQSEEKLNNFKLIEKLQRKKVKSKAYISEDHMIKSSTNNTIFTLTTLQGKVVFVRSCGCLGFQGKKKRTTKCAIESTLQAVTEKAKELGWLKLILHLNGFAKGRLYALKTLKKSGISFVKLVEKTPLPHNGCRPKKIRRG